jgi:GTPase
LAEVSLVLLVPGMGDELQALKAGIMEIADVFVINKADRPQVEKFQQELESVLSLCVRPDNWKPPVLKTIATEDQGVLEVIEAIASFTQFRTSHPEFAESRRYETEEDILALLKERLLTRVLEEEDVRDKVRVATQAVRTRKMDPYTAVEQIVEQLHKPGVAGPAR